MTNRDQPCSNTKCFKNFDFKKKTLKSDNFLEDRKIDLLCCWKFFKILISIEVQLQFAKINRIFLSGI